MKEFVKDYLNAPIDCFIRDSVLILNTKSTKRNREFKENEVYVFSKTNVDLIMKEVDKPELIDISELKDSSGGKPTYILKRINKRER